MLLVFVVIELAVKQVQVKRECVAGFELHTGRKTQPFLGIAPIGIAVEPGKPEVIGGSSRVTIQTSGKYSGGGGINIGTYIGGGASAPAAGAVTLLQCVALAIAQGCQYADCVPGV